MNNLIEERKLIFDMKKFSVQIASSITKTSIANTVKDAKVIYKFLSSE